MSVSDIYGQITSGSTGFLGLLSNIFNMIGSLFGTTTDGVFTPNIFGVVTFIALGAGLVWVAMKIIRHLLTRATKGN